MSDFHQMHPDCPNWKFTSNLKHFSPSDSLHNYAEFFLDAKKYPYFNIILPYLKIFWI